MDVLLANPVCRFTCAGGIAKGYSPLVKTLRIHGRLAGEPAGTINVRTEPGAVVLTYRTPVGRPPSGNQSLSGCRSLGRIVTLEAVVPGLSVQSTAMANTEGVELRFCMALRTTLRVGIATA